VAFGRIENHGPKRMIVLAGEKILDNRRNVGFALVGFAPGGTVTEIFKHQVNVPIEPIGGNDRGRLTHTRLHNEESHV
jgi:hypothetical protein